MFFRRFGTVALAAWCASMLAVGPAHAQSPDTAPTAPVRLATPVLSVRRAPEFLVAPTADRRLQQVVDKVREAAPETSCISVVDGDRKVVDINTTASLTPASLQKLLTATALVDRVGADTVFTTRVVARAPASSGVIDGDVWLVGAGDPILTTKGYQQAFEDQAQAWTDLASLADAVAASGVTRIRGNLVGDDSRFDQERYFSGWPTRYQRQDQVGPLSALTVNDGVTGYANSPDEPTGARRPGDPPVLAAETLRTLLADRGVVVEGTASAGRAPTDITEVAHLDSLPVTGLVGEMLAESDNTTAEILLKELGVRAGTAGSTSAGAEVVRSALADRNLPLDGVVIHDGSGLDEDDRVTCQLISTLLIQHGPDSAVANGLPVAGQSGTLRKRLGDTPAEGRVRAKTGTLNTVFSLAGWATGSDDRPLAFTAILNGTVPGGVALLDELAVALAEYPQRPDPATVSPRPVQS
jgi:D-alanyl-D-alanine carboxypeptidase/D-alanyl-D-alanine-endopeptidase (penicillin-binding protein 4)